MNSVVKESLGMVVRPDQQTPEIQEAVQLFAYNHSKMGAGNITPKDIALFLSVAMALKGKKFIEAEATKEPEKAPAPVEKEPVEKEQTPSYAADRELKKDDSVAVMWEGERKIGRITSTNGDKVRVAIEGDARQYRELSVTDILE